MHGNDPTSLKLRRAGPPTPFGLWRVEAPDYDPCHDVQGQAFEGRHRNREWKS